MPLDVVGLHLGQRLPEPGVSLGAFKLHRLMIVHRRHRDAGVDCGEDRAALCGIDPVAECVEPLMQLGPERDAVGSDRREGHRPEAGDVLVADLAALTTALRSG